MYTTAHQHIYRALLDLHESDAPIDVMTVSHQLEKMGKLQEIGGQAEVATIARDDATFGDGREYAEVLREDYVRRTLKRSAEELQSATMNPIMTVGDLLAVADEIGIDLDTPRENVLTVGQVVRHVRDSIRMAVQYPDRGQGIHIEIPKLRRMLHGWQLQDLILVCARPSAGKTAYGLCIAAEAQCPVLIESKEMKSEALGYRMLSSSARIDSHTLRSGRAWNSIVGSYRSISDVEWRKIDQAVDEDLKDLPIYIDDRCFSVDDVASVTRKMVREKGVKLVIVDYLQLLNPPAGKKYGNREQEVARIGESLKEIAKRNNVALVALTQLSRAIEMRSDKRPMLSDLRESGTLEQHADIVIGLHRPGAYDAAADQDVAEIIVLKHRNGPTGKVNAWFRQATGRWEERTDDNA